MRNETGVRLTQLEVFTEYNIMISAFNNIGSGPNTSLLTVRTTEEGETFILHVVL